MPVRCAPATAAAMAKAAMSPPMGTATMASGIDGTAPADNPFCNAADGITTYADGERVLPLPVTITSGRARTMSPANCSSRSPEPSPHHVSMTRFFPST